MEIDEAALSWLSENNVDDVVDDDDDVADDATDHVED